LDELAARDKLLMSASATGVAILLWLTPPYVLMLGESAPHSGQVLKLVSNTVAPLRVVSLLDRGRLGGNLGSYSSMTDSLRSGSDEDWRAIVDGLADFVPAIVLDARTHSRIVAQEVGLIIAQPDRLRRTTFIVDEDGSAPALTANGLSAPSPSVRTVTVEGIEGLLRRYWL
jgi:hypothetical protein